MSFSVPGLIGRAGAVLLGVLVVCVSVLSVGGPARADTAHLSALPAVAAMQAVPRLATTAVACPAQADASRCDSDGDGIPDWVELKVCGSATCATGREDTNHNGVPDWVEVQACGSTTCVSDPGADANGNGIPDWVERVLCGSVSCATGHEDGDGNKIPDWTEIVICGAPGCSTGTEDYNHNGVPDWKELAACLKEPGQGGAGTGAGGGALLAGAGAGADLAADPVGVLTRGTWYWFGFCFGAGNPADAPAGEVAGWAWLVAAGLALAGLLFLILWRRRRNNDNENPEDDDPAQEEDPNGGSSDGEDPDTGNTGEGKTGGLEGLLGVKHDDAHNDGDANDNGEGVLA